MTGSPLGEDQKRVSGRVMACNATFNNISVTSWQSRSWSHGSWIYIYV